MSDLIDCITVCRYVFGFQVQDVMPEDCFDYSDSDIDICTTTIIVDALTDQPVAIERWVRGLSVLPLHFQHEN